MHDSLIGFSYNESLDYSLRTPSIIAGDKRSPQSNLQVDITHAPHVCSQHSFGLPLRMNGMHKTQFDHARFDLLRVFI